MADYIKNPIAIEDKSMDIIDGYLKKDWREEELPVVRRMIHTTGDPDYEGIISMTPDFIEKASESLKKGGKIYTDTKMVMSGISAKILERAGLTLCNYIADKDIAEGSKKTGITRSSLTVDKAVSDGIKIFVIGNAPTALFRLLELADEGFVPDFIVGVPVGFVGARESKELLSQYSIPHITTLSNKGGSNVAASVINALLYMNFGR